MEIAPIFLIFKHYIKRMLRSWFGLFVFVVLPVIIAAVISFIYSGNAEGEIYVNGYNMVATYISIYMMLLFQLNGGIYLLDFINRDMIKEMKWRIRVSPNPPFLFIFVCIIACTVFTTLQGILIIGSSALFLNAYWGNIWIAVGVIVLISVISQLMNMLFLILTGNAGTAESLSWSISSAMVVLAGAIFTLPDNRFFQFMKEYGTPYSLARSAILESGFLKSKDNGSWFYIIALSAVVILLALMVIIMGRRKMR